MRALSCSFPPESTRAIRRISAAAVATGDEFADSDRSLKIADVKTETRAASAYFYSNA